jgi:hypothetical protein
VTNRAVLAAAFASVALLAAAPGCGRLKSETPGADAGGGPDAVEASPPVTGCLIGSSPVAMSTVCGPHPELCGDVCGTACVDLVRDSDNCGACGVRCKATAACNDGVCGAEPQVLVPSAPGCRSLRLAYEDGAITWLDLGHGTLKRIATAGGTPTSLATGLHPAAIFSAADQPLFVNGGPVVAGLVVRGGTVTWIEADDEVVLDEQSLPHGGAGTTIRSVTAGAAPVTLLSADLAPPKAPLTALSLSPDGKTLYFGAGTRLYKMPSAGAKAAADVQLVGFTSGPEHGFATSLAADDHRLFFPASVDTWVEIFDMTQKCDLAAPAGPVGPGGYSCPSIVFGSHPIPLMDTVIVQDGFFYWAKENNVWRADLATADPALDGHATASDTIATFSVTGFAIGPQHAYFGENVYVERGDFAPVMAGGAPRARILARGQTWPSSFAIDGANVYWTTTACDISFIADSPQ